MAIVTPALSSVAAVPGWVSRVPHSGDAGCRRFLCPWPLAGKTSGPGPLFTLGGGTVCLEDGRTGCCLELVVAGVRFGDSPDEGWWDTVSAFSESARAGPARATAAATAMLTLITCRAGLLTARAWDAFGVLLNFRLRITAPSCSHHLISFP